MRAWGWVGGGLVVLVGAGLVIALVGAPGRLIPDATRVPEGQARARVVGAALPQRVEPRHAMPPILGRLDDVRGDGLASEIDRQRSAMRAAVAMLVAGEHAGARTR